MLAQVTCEHLGPRPVHARSGRTAEAPHALAARVPCLGTTPGAREMPTGSSTLAAIYFVLMMLGRSNAVALTIV